MPKLSPTPEQVQIIRSIVKDGGYIPDIVRKLKLSWPVIKRWTTELGLEVPPTPRRVSNNQRLYGLGMCDPRQNGEASRMFRAKKLEESGDTQRISLRDRLRNQNHA
jgi:hypothetical protein